MAKRKIWITDEEFTQRRHQYAGGGKVSAQNQLMQIIQAYCQATGADPKQVIGTLQKMKPEQQQAAVQQMAAQLQKAQAPQQQEADDEVVMAGGGIVSMLSNFLGGMGKGGKEGGEGAVGGDMSGNILGASLGYMQSSLAGLADVIAESSPGAGMTRIVPDSRPTSLNSNRVMAGGGTVRGVPVNVEHGEVMDTGGAVTQVQGKSHEQGGENRAVPEGTTIFSERISIDGKTMAQRKLDRERAVKRIAKVFEKNPGDYINQNTLKRTMQVADIQEQQDLKIQEAASSAMMPPQVQPGAQPGGNPQQDAQVAAYGSSGVMRYAGGTPPFGVKTKFAEDEFDNSPGEFAPIEVQMSVPKMLSVSPDMRTVNNGQPLLPIPKGPLPYQSGYVDSVVNKGIKRLKDTGIPYLGVHQDEDLVGDDPWTGEGEQQEQTFPYTKGDKVGMAGMGVGSFGPMAMTLANRFGDKPNINPYKDYGTDARKSSKAALANLGYLKDNTIADITLAENAGFERNRNTTRSLSTNRALDLTTMMAGNRAKLDARGQYAKDMMAQFGVDAQITADSDKYRMAGEAKRDAGDRADRDNFYSQFSTNLADTGKTLQEAGKNMNTNQSNKNFLAMMKDLNKYSLTADFDPMGYYKGIKTAKK